MEQKNINWQTGDIYDPFLQQGGVNIYQNQHKFTICIQEKPQIIQKLPNPQILTVKVVVLQQQGIPKNIRIQLTSDSDLYFNFIFMCNDWQFKRVRQKQNLYIEFRQYPIIILKHLEKLQEQGNKYATVFTIFSQAQGKMDIIRHTEFKDDTILSFDFNKASEEQIRQSIQFRYDQMRQQFSIHSKCYEEMAETVRAKNPSLMMQIKKALRKK